MTRFSRESYLADPVLAYLRRRGFPDLATELPFYEHRIDVYGYSRRKDLSVAVELKLTKWRRAFHQALLYQLCADVALLAMPHRMSKRIDLGLLEGNGIGLIEIADDGSCSERLAPKPSGVVLPHYKQTYTAIAKEASSCRR